MPVAAGKVLSGEALKKLLHQISVYATAVGTPVAADSYGKSFRAAATQGKARVTFPSRANAKAAVFSAATAAVSNDMP